MLRQNRSGSSSAADFELRDMVGHLIRTTQQVHVALWTQSSEGLRLTSPQFAVLHALSQEQPMDQRSLGAKASLDRSTVADMVSRMVKQGLLSRAQDPSDARRKLVRLTELGLKTHQDAARHAVEVNKRLLTALEDQERDTLLVLLNKVLEHHRLLIHESRQARAELSPAARAEAGG